MLALAIEAASARKRRRVLTLTANDRSWSGAEAPGGDGKHLFPDSHAVAFRRRQQC